MKVSWDDGIREPTAQELVHYHCDPKLVDGDHENTCSFMKEFSIVEGKRKLIATTYHPPHIPVDCMSWTKESTLHLRN
jgi:hypothetical protein